MASCQVQGKPDLYGLGIRVAFYIQWFGAIIAEYLDASGLPDVRLMGLLFSAAAFLGLVVSLSTTTLDPADVYIVLLLAMGFYIFLVPLYIWKALTCCNPYWDPFRWSKETMSPAYKGMNFILLLALSSLGVWYWCSFATENACAGQQVGFFFSPVSLGSKVFIAFNALMYLVIILVCTGILLMKAGWEVDIWSKERRRRKISKVHVVAVQELKTFSNLAVAGTLTAATELAISWNNIPNVNYVADLAQTIPLFVSGGFLIRVLFLHFAGADGASDSSSESSEGEHTSRHSSYMTDAHHSGSRGSGWPPAPPPVRSR